MIQNAAELTANDVISRNLDRSHIMQWIPRGSRRILDVGCNEGETALRLRRDHACAEVYGLETMESCRPALELLDGYWIRDVCEGGVEGIPAGFFEHLLLHDVLEHTSDPWRFLSLLRRVAAPNARFYVIVPNASCWFVIWQLLHGEFRYGYPGGVMNEDHIRWFTPESLARALNVSGLEVIDMQLLGHESLTDGFPCHDTKTVTFPVTDGVERISVTFDDPARAKQMRYTMAAVKVLAIARNTGRPMDDRRITPNSLNAREVAAGFSTT